MDQLLRELLNKLNEIGEDHPELFDSAVAERLTEAVYHGFLQPASGYVLPDNFGMYSVEANQRVKEAVLAFLIPAAVQASDCGMTFHQRLASFQNLDIAVGPQRRDYNDFFRYFPPSRFDSIGSPIETD